MDDIWCNRKINKEKNIDENIETLKNELQKKPARPLNKLIYNKFSFSNLFKNNITTNNINTSNTNNNSILIKNENDLDNIQNKKNINKNNLINQNIKYNNNHSFYIQPKPISPYNNNLINFQKYNPIQMGSAVSTSSDTKTTSQESNNNFQRIKQFLSKGDINKQFQTTQNNFYSTFYNPLNNFNLINNNMNNNSNFSSTFPMVDTNVNNNYLNPYFSTANILQNQNLNLCNSNLNCENEFIINIKDIIQGREKRTSVRIKNIPVKYSNQDFMKEIDTRMGFNMNIHYRNYDLFYLPMNYSNTRNLGYAFINFVDPICIIDFLYRFKGIKLKSNNCHKECQITFAKYQGRKEITSHLLNSSGEGKKPFLFTINKNRLRIRVPKKYSEEIIKNRRDLINILEFYDI